MWFFFLINLKSSDARNIEKVEGKNRENEMNALSIFLQWNDYKREKIVQTMCNVAVGDEI